MSGMNCVLINDKMVSCVSSLILYRPGAWYRKVVSRSVKVTLFFEENNFLVYICLLLKVLKLGILKKGLKMYELIKNALIFINLQSLTARQLETRGLYLNVLKF